MNPQDPQYRPQQPPAGAPPVGQPYYQQQSLGYTPQQPPYSAPQPQPYGTPQPNGYPAPQPQPQPSEYAPQQAPNTYPIPQQQPTPLPPSAITYDANGYPVDYLNQIAAPIPQKTVNKFAVFGMIFGFLALAITAALVLSGAGTPNITTQATLARDNVRALKIVTTEQQKHLADNNLSSLNATLTASLTTISTDITELLGEKASTSADANKPKDKEVIAAQTVLSQKLNDAYLTGTLDRTYASEMSYQLRLLSIQLKKLANTGRTSASREIYTKNAPSLDAITKKLAESTSSQ